MRSHFITEKEGRSKWRPCNLKINKLLGIGGIISHLEIRKTIMTSYSFCED
jgi:hypothetical protein